MLIPQSVNLRDFFQARRRTFLTAFFLATLASGTQLQIVSNIAAQTPTPSIAPSAKQERTIVEQPHSTDSNAANQPWSVPHGDIWVFAATMLLVIATFWLSLITRKHVKHTQQLVDTVKTILEIDRIARLAVLVTNGDDGNPCARLQNLGRSPLMIDNLSFEFLDENNDRIETAQVDELQNIWILPNEARIVSHPTLSATWNKGRPIAVKIECNFFDVYRERNKIHRSNPITSTWICDHDRRVIVLRPVEE